VVLHRAAGGCLAGVRLTAKRVERAAEASGTAVAEAVRERSGLIASRKLRPMPPSPRPDKLYGVIDGTGVPMTARETAGRPGKGEDSRARTREVKLAVFTGGCGPGTGSFAGSCTRLNRSSNRRPGSAAAQR
jgi:hypothetical protein